LPAFPAADFGFVLDPPFIGNLSIGPCEVFMRHASQFDSSSAENFLAELARPSEM
jgi:hypothetical protein